jgi:uncharacterized protein YerC
MDATTDPALELEDTSADGETQPAAPGADGVVAFEHPFFAKLEGAYFSLTGDSDEPALVVALGDNPASLPFPGIQREFDISDASPDGQMLHKVAEALNYVAALRVGDPLPAEVLTGKASWEITAEHRLIAQSRLNLQLVTWLSGGENLYTDIDQLRQIASDPGTKAKVNEAFSQAAEQIGFGRQNREQVIHLIEDLAEELAHIEALRERMADVDMMVEKIQTLRRLYGHSMSVLEIVDPVARLIVRGRKAYQDIFDQLDAQTGEVIAALKNVDAQKLYIRRIRDDLYKRLNAWQDMFKKWHAMKAVRSHDAEELLRQTYRFLAQRFMKVDEWHLYTKLQTSNRANRTEVRW